MDRDFGFGLFCQRAVFTSVARRYRGGGRGACLVAPAVPIRRAKIRGIPMGKILESIPLTIVAGFVLAIILTAIVKAIPAG
jgi:hypothetical protein